LETVRYRNIWFRAIIAFIASSFVMLVGHKMESIIRGVKGDPRFYLAYSISYGIALLLVYLVHFATIKLDERHDWRKNTKERIFWQFLLGFIPPVLLDLGLISIHSAILGEGFGESRFLRLDFPIIVLMLFILNLYYWIHYLYLTEPSSKSIDHDKSEIIDSPVLLTINYDNSFIQLISDEILCFYRFGNSIRIVTKEKEYTTKKLFSLGELETKYANEDFLRINRGTILNMKTVKGYRVIDYRSLEIKLHEPIQVKEPHHDLFIVSQKYIQPFKVRIQSS
jgi:LytTr DNA-binding domain